MRRRRRLRVRWPRSRGDSFIALLCQLSSQCASRHSAAEPQPPCWALWQDKGVRPRGGLAIAHAQVERLRRRTTADRRAERIDQTKVNRAARMPWPRAYGPSSRCLVSRLPIVVTERATVEHNILTLVALRPLGGEPIALQAPARGDLTTAKHGRQSEAHLFHELHRQRTPSKG